MNIFLLSFWSSKSPEKTDGSKLFSIALDGINELTKYKSISKQGKYEVLIFNGLSVLKSFNTRYPHKYTEVEDEFFTLLFSKAGEYGITFRNFDKWADFINSRFQLYSKEVDSLYSARNGRLFVPAISYTTFYISPLEEDFDPSDDLLEITLFMGALVKMIRLVDDNANKI